MCIFAYPIHQVTDTRILVASCGNNVQFTVYENKVSCDSGNAMILPVPEGNIQLFDMSKYPGIIWDDLDHSFPRRMMESHAFGGFGGGGGWGTKSVLPVQQVGGYKCSVVPTLADMCRINSAVFTLPKDIETLLQTHYGKGFSFIVCMFERVVNAHPIAYMHMMKSDGTVFIPTRHEHGEEVSFDTSSGFRMSEEPSLIIHNATCDICSRQIGGIRYKCMNCDNFDTCSMCIDKHDHMHTFARIKYPTENLWTEKILNASVYPSNPSKSAEVSQYDHTIYIVNAAILHGASEFTELLEGRPNDQYVKWNAVFPGRTINMRRIQKMTIKGRFRNQDYYAGMIR